MYMNRKLVRNAIRKFWFDSPISFGTAEKLVTVVGRQVHRVDQRAQFVHGVAEGLVAFQVRRDHDLPHHAEAVDGGRSLRWLQRRKAGQVAPGRRWATGPSVDRSRRAGRG